MFSPAILRALFSITIDIFKTQFPSLARDCEMPRGKRAQCKNTHITYTAGINDIQSLGMVCSIALKAWRKWDELFEGDNKCVKKQDLH